MSTSNSSQNITPLQGDCGEHSIVQKSYPLLSLWKSHLSLAELKILDTYLARIDSHHPEQRWVRFEKGELENILGIKRIRIDALKERLSNLCIVVHIDDPEAPHGFRSIALFEQMLCDQGDDDLWQVDMQCTSAAMQYIFNLDNIGYLKYRLYAVLHLRSRYSYVLFLYVERNRFRGQWEVSVEELREILRCGEDSCYHEFKRFNDRILKRAHREILDKTDCRFFYEPIKKGRQVCSIRFSYMSSPAIGPAVLSQKESNEESENTSLISCENMKRKEAIQFLSSACVRNGEPEFSNLELEHLLEILRIIPVDRMPQCTPGNDIIFSMHHYLAEKYAAMNRLDASNEIQNRFAYMEHILKQDAGLL